MALTTKTLLSQLTAYLRKAYMECPALDANTGEPCEAFPYRWAAERLTASIRVCVDFGNGKTADFSIELPDPK